MKTRQEYFPYQGLEFHLAASIRMQRENPKEADAHYVASEMFTNIGLESDLDIKKEKIKRYKSYCKEHKIDAFSVIRKKI